MPKKEVAEKADLLEILPALRPDLEEAIASGKHQPIRLALADILKSIEALEHRQDQLKAASRD